MLFVYLHSDILPFFHRDIYVINTFVCTYWLKSTQHCRVDMQFELFFSIYFYKWHICITCCVMVRIWIMRQICVILVCHEYGHVWVEERCLVFLMDIWLKTCSREWLLPKYWYIGTCKLDLNTTFRLLTCLINIEL